ncbi:MAG: hypothetical protein LBO80_07385 [Treponema sp.]|jgi:hypothetical protein|nr:hypothetical protein [Treponema sp.]
MEDKAIKDKAAYVAKVFPQISDRGEEYLEKVARALFLLQNPAVTPLAGKDEDDKKPAQKSRSS